MTFRHASTEQAFLDNRKAWLLKCMRNAHLLFLSVPTVLGLALLEFHYKGDHELDKECPGVIEQIGVIAASWVVFNIIVITITLTPRCVNCFTTKGMEIFITVESLCTMFIMYISDKTGAPKLQGVDARLCFRRMEGPEPTFCDTHVVLVWAIAQMSLHLFFPIRWRILVPAEMLSVVFYMLVLSSSTEGLSDAAATWVMSTVLVAVCAMGKRRLEYQERLSMLMFISEKTLRFQSEFILSQAQLQKKAPSPSSEASLAIDTRSLASAPLSQYIFGKDGEMELDVQLQAILQLGKVEHWIIEPSQLQCFPEVLLGRGVFGVVILGDLCGAATAVKLPFAKQALALDDLSNEIRILRRIRHPNIVGFHGVCVLTSLQVMVLVEEYIHGRSMASQMKDKKKPCERCKVSWHLARRVQCAAVPPQLEAYRCPRGLEA
ncbi:unnamed protein product [Polarella glacialis]|uniref:Protein kinase domain-containing protein n=1 Tax=Polarella glacialis TaxID=89957 RepID=A0A813EHT1_POLGL|nr:unnamed protein product [Polarella glacialis]